MRILCDPCERDLKKMEMTEEDDEGFQSEPEIITIQDGSPDLEPEQLPPEVNSETNENDENRRPSNEIETNDNNQDTEDDTTGCPICLELWTNSGPHRVCSLRCGHLFGRQCIDRWLAGGRIKCPQCNSPAKRADIRVLYCKRLVALDTTERDRLEAQVAAQRHECKRLEESLAQANLSAQLLRAELESLRTDFSRIKKRKLFDSSTGDSSALAQRKPLKFLRRAILGHSDGFQCRTVAFDPQYGIFLVSRSDNENTGGVVKVSLWDASGSEFVALHDGPVRAIACSPHGDGLFLTCGADDRLKLSTMSSNSVLQTWKLSSNPWSCAFHPGSINHVLVGLSSGQVAMYDLRDNPLQISPKLFNCPQKSKYPVHSLHVISIKEQFYIVGATMEGPFALKLTDDDIDKNAESITETPKSITSWSSDFGYKGFACNSLSLDPVNRCIFLASYRSVPPRGPSRHVVFELLVSDQGQLEMKLPFSEFKSVESSVNRTPFRSSIISVSGASSNEGIECLIPDESTFSGHSFQLQLSSSSFSTNLSPAEILSTNAGIPIIETCLGRVGKSKQQQIQIDLEDDIDSYHVEDETTLVIGMLTVKHLYIYTTS